MNFINRIKAMFTRKNTVQQIMQGFQTQVDQLNAVAAEQDETCKRCAADMIAIADKSKAARDERDAANAVAGKLKEFTV